MLRFDHPAPNVGSAVDPTIINRIDRLSDEYKAYLTDLAGAEHEQAVRSAAAEREREIRNAAAERDRAIRSAARAHIEERRASIQKLLNGPMPPDLRARLADTIRQTTADPSAEPVALLNEIDTALTRLKPRIDVARTLIEASTDKNRFLFEGDPQDILFLYNSSPYAVGVARGLDGKLGFDKDKTTICSLQRQPDDRIVQEQLTGRLRSLGAPVVTPLPLCTEAQQLAADVLVFQRGLLEAQAKIAVKIASAVDTGVFSFMGSISAAEIRTAREAEAIESSQVEADVVQGTSEGLALLALDNGSRTICRITIGDADLYARLLQPYAGRLNSELKGATNTVISSAEGAFLSAKRGQCGAVFASAKELAGFAKALSRDGVSFRYLPIWVAPEKVAEGSRAITEQAEAARRGREAEAETRQKLRAAETRKTLTDALNTRRAEAEALMRVGLSPDINSFLMSFNADVLALGPASPLDRLRELEGQFADMKPRINEAVRLARSITVKSRFLVEGDRNDLLVLYNSSGKAPSVVRNLRGELSFENGTAVACVYHAAIADTFINRQIRERTATFGASLRLPLEPCKSGALPSQDLVFVERDRLLREPIDRVSILVNAVNSGLFSKLTVIDAAALTTAKQAETAMAIDVEASIRKQSSDVFGFVVIPNGSSVVCEVASETDAEALSAVLKRLEARLSDELPGRPAIAASSANGAFVSVKRAQCGAVFAGASDLLALVIALERDGLSFRFLPLKISREEVADARAKIEEAKRAAVEQMMDRERELKQRQAIEQSKKNEDFRRKTVLEEKLRAQYGVMARTFETALCQEVKDFVTGDKDLPFAAKYPSLARIYKSLIDDKWQQ